MDVFEAGGATVIDDAYNANPDSMRAGLKGLERIGAGRRKLAVLGEMLELGGESEAEHASLGEEVGRAGVSLLACLPGTRALSQAAADAGVGVHDAPDAADALAWLRATLAPGDAVLLKGSHGSGVWRIADALREETK
jgi:UDP-N-acetylmuramoyl-tripeptide--D-alanyl-D-alanine ligase